MEDVKNLIKREIEFDKFKNTSVFVTGGNSLIGKYFILMLLELNKEKNLNIDIVTLVRNKEKALNTYKDYLDQITFINQDICDPIKYDGKIDYIVHTAGSASPKFIINDPVGIIKANTMGTMNLLEFAKEKNVKNVLYTSTREIYGKTPDVICLSEDQVGGIQTLEARACYPESKRMGEAIFEAYKNQYDVPFNIVRMAHTYGPTMEIKNDGRVMADLISFVVNDQDITLNSDGSAIRSFCYITDAIDAMTRVLLNGENGEAYNLSNETEPYPIKEVAEKLIKLYPEKNLKLILNAQSEFKKGGYNKIPVIRLDTTKIENLGWKPEITLEDGMKQTVDSFSKKLTK